MNIITQIFIKNIENTLKILSEDILASINTYVNRSLRYIYINSKISLSDLLSIPNKVVMDSIIKNVILTLEKLDEDCFNSPQRKALYYPKGTYSRTIITLFWEVTFKRCAYVDKNGKNHFYYLDSLLIFHLVLFSIMMLLMNFYSLPGNILQFYKSRFLYLR